MEWDKNKTVSFSGYRPQKFEFPLSSNDMYEKLVNAVFVVIMQTIDLGYNRFIIGGAPGFDIICAELIRLAKSAEQQDIKMMCALPYNNFGKSDHFDEDWKSRYNSIIEDCDHVINVTEKYHKTNGCYKRRNEFMIDNSNMLICYHTGKKGGTASTIRYAELKDLEIINIAGLLK